MHSRIRVLWVLGVLAIAANFAAAKTASKPQDGQTIVIVFKDGHQQSFAMADIARIEFKGAAAKAMTSATAEAPTAPLLSQNHFLGKWELGEGNGNNFIVTLEANGEATKSIGSSHGTWTVWNGEARITWDDGSHDAIRKVGSQYEKFWYPDGNFSGKPGNVTGAKHIESKPI
jgi:hypothetical protein